MKTVVICGSNKFADKAREFAEKLEKLGVVVYVPHFYRASGGIWDRVHEFDKPFVALGLNNDHFYKISMADVVFIYNQDGYSGNSTTLEIGYATALKKPIYALSDQDEEICRQVLFRGKIETPEALLEKLK